MGQNLYDPTNAANAVVSLVDLMGIRVVSDKGAELRPGREVGAGLLTLTEGQVRGLITMTYEDLAEADEELGPGPVSIADLYEGLASSLPAGYSLDQFAAAYDEAYATEADSIAAGVMLGQPISPTTRLLRAQMWLLLIDGFVGPRTQAIAAARTIALPSGRRLGAARQYQPPLTSLDPSLTDAEWAELMSSLPLLPFFIGFIVVQYGNIHEGHAGLGARVEFKATVSAPGPWIGSNNKILLHEGQAPGLTISWDSRDLGTLSVHGTLNGNIRTPVTLDANGEARISYTPKHEVANGQGESVLEIGDLSAYASQYELVAHYYSLRFADGPARHLIKGKVTADQQPIEIAWHERDYILLSIVNVYEFTVGVSGGPDLLTIYRKGSDASLGELSRRPDGTYRGAIGGLSDSIAVGEAFLGLAGTAACHDTLEAFQLLYVVGELRGNDTMVLRFYPATTPGVEDPDTGATNPNAQFPPCQAVIPFPGGGAYNRPPGAYIPINDTRWSNPDSGYEIELPQPGQQVLYNDETQVNAAPNVCSVFYVGLYRSDPSQSPAPSPPPIPVAPKIPGLCDQTTPPP